MCGCVKLLIKWGVVFDLWVVFDLLIDVNDYGFEGEPKELYYYPKVDQFFQDLSIQSNTLFPTPKKVKEVNRVLSHP